MGVVVFLLSIIGVVITGYWLQEWDRKHHKEEFFDDDDVIDTHVPFDDER